MKTRDGFVVGILILAMAWGTDGVAVPTPEFSGLPTTGPAHLAVDFSDESTGDPTGWAWYFGEEACAGTWTQMTAAAGWSARLGHAAVTLPDGSVVLTGGANSGGFLNDAWRSTDQGATWTQMTAAGGWTTRYHHASCVLADGSVVIAGGGNMPDQYLNDVWRSTDQGATWTQMTAAAGWTARSAHCAVALSDGSMVIAGGQSAGGVCGDVWRSTDQGATWTQMTAAAEWTGRVYAACVALAGDRILIMGGMMDNGEGKNDIWASDDHGANWAELSTQNPWTARSALAAAVLPDGAIVVMGGAQQVGGARVNDVWRSPDGGTSWVRDNATAEWPMRYRHAATVLHDGSILLIGGDSGLGWAYNDVWRLPTAGSNQQDPSYTYTAEGSFQVSLQAYDATGKASIRKADYITVTGVVHVIAVSAEPPAGGTASGGGNYDPDDEVTVVAAANPGYSFVNWTEDGTAVSSSASYSFAATASRTLVANFAISTYTVTFRTDGTEGATVNGALLVTDTVDHGGSTIAVTAEAPLGYEFLGWSGGYVGTENPLTVTNVASDLAITANFQMDQVACGSVFEINAADIAGLPTEGTFMLKPKVYAIYDLNGKPGKATVKLLDIPAKGVGAASLRGEWTKKIRRYDLKAFKAAEAGGIGAAEWITAATMRDLPMDLHVAGKEIPGGDQLLQPLALAVPVIADIADGGKDAKDNDLLVINGQWFGTKRPKAWREYWVPGKAEDTFIVKRQAMKVVKPTEADALLGFKDSKGKPAHMNPETGESKVVVIVPAKQPKGLPNGTIVLDNGVGMAAGGVAVGDAP
jgi:PKD repeat protein